MKFFQFKKAVYERMCDRPMSPKERTRFFMIYIDDGMKMTKKQEQEYCEYVKFVNAMHENYPAFFDEEKNKERLKW